MKRFSLVCVACLFATCACARFPGSRVAFCADLARHPDIQQSFDLPGVIFAGPNSGPDRGPDGGPNGGPKRGPDGGPNGPDGGLYAPTPPTQAEYSAEIRQLEQVVANDRQLERDAPRDIRPDAATVADEAQQLLDFAKGHSGGFRRIKRVVGLGTTASEARKSIEAIGTYAADKCSYPTDTTTTTR